MAEMSVEQRRALALARARVRLQQQPTAPEGTQTAGWQAFTPSGERTGDDGVQEDVFGDNRLGLGPAEHALTSTYRQIGLTGRAALSGVGAGPVADMAGLPAPETAKERIVSGTAGLMTGAGLVSGGSRLLAAGAGRVTKPYLEMLAQNPGLQATSALTGGVAGEVAKEEGVGPLGQTAATLAGSVAGPAGVAGGKALWKGAVDTLATVGAAYGNKAGVKRLAEDVANRYAGDVREQILFALRRAQDMAPGVKPTVSDAIAQRNLGQPDQVGGALVRLQKDLSGARGIEDVLPSAVRGQDAAVKQHISNVVEAAKIPRQEALNAANANGGVDARSVLNSIDDIARTPENKDNPILQKVLDDTKASIKKAMGPDQKIDSRRLYTIRKVMGLSVEKHSKENADWGKKYSSGLERDVQKGIDDAIEAAGGRGWKEYLAKYSEGLKQAENVNLVRGEAKRIAAGVKGQSAAALGKEDLPKVPTLLHRPMMFINFGLRMVGQDANEPLVKELARRMQDPAEFAALMQRPPSDPLRKQSLAILQKAAVVATMRAKEAEQGAEISPDEITPPTPQGRAETLRGINPSFQPRQPSSPMNPNPGFVRG